MTKRIEEDLAIDPNRLDESWLAQPGLYYDYAARLADARRDVDEEKADLDLTKAELDRRMRADPEKYGLAKVTEAALSAAVLAHREYRNVQEQLLECKHRADVMQAAVTAFDHRKSALSKLVDLFLANYWSRPTASGEAKERMDEVEKASVRRRGKGR